MVQYLQGGGGVDEYQEGVQLEAARVPHPRRPHRPRHRLQKLFRNPQHVARAHSFLQRACGLFAKREAGTFPG